MKTNHIISLISTIREKANRFLVQEMSDRNITGLVPSHGDILVALFGSASLTMKELANIIGKDKSTVTALVDKLVALNYVQKRKDEADNRIVHVSLTGKGRALQPDFEEISRGLLAIIYKDITDSEKEVLINLLTKIKSNF